MCSEEIVHEEVCSVLCLYLKFIGGLVTLCKDAAALPLL